MSERDPDRKVDTDYKERIAQLRMEDQIKHAEMVKLTAEGDQLRDSRRYTEAIGAYRRALELTAQKWDLFNSIGLCQNMLEQYDAAKETFRKAIEEKKTFGYPTFHEAWYNMAQVHFNERNYPEALNACEIALHGNPSLSWAWYLKGWILDELDRTSEAIECIRRFMLFGGTEEEIKGSLHHSFLSVKLPFANLKRKELPSSSQAGKASASFWYNQAIHQFFKPNLSIAGASADMATKLDKNSQNAWVLKAMCLLNQEKYNQALECCNRALALEPGHNIAVAIIDQVETWKRRGGGGFWRP